MAELAANTAMRESIRAAVDQGLPVYAECGGLMYLARSLTWRDQTAPMVGALPADVRMHERPVGRGYVSLTVTADAPWSTQDSAELVRGHEFHYSSLENVSPDVRFAYAVKRGHGIDGEHDGMVYRNVLASYSHLRSKAGSNWAPAFVDFVRNVQSTCQQKSNAQAGLFVTVNGERVATDAEGYLLDLTQWTEDFARARARIENLVLTEPHWEVIRFIRDYYEEHRVQAQVRSMIKHFTARWGAERGSNHHLHALFPVGGPQKQGNRLAGLLKTKGEH